MPLLRNRPIKQKVTLGILLTAGAALFVACAALFVFQLITFRQNFTRDLEMLGNIVNSQMPAALTFRDSGAAEDMFKTLNKFKPHIVYGDVIQQTSQGEVVFARFERTYQARPPAATKVGLTPHGKYLFYTQPIVEQDGDIVGTLHLGSDYAGEFQRLLWLNAGVLLGVLSFSILLTFVLSGQLQRVISKPILELAGTAKKVAGDKDYSVRVPKLEEDEIGALTDAFNQMLSQVQSQDSAIRSSRQKFESLVTSIEGVVWEADPATLRFTFVSPQAERLLGFPVSEWLQDQKFWQNHIHPEDYDSFVRAFGQALQDKQTFSVEYRMTTSAGATLWFRNITTVVLEEDQPVLLRGVLLDVTKQRQAADELEALHKELVQTSRQAGMAEVATGVLHNVGNVLNSVNVSAALVCDRVRGSETRAFSRIAAILREHEGDLAAFLTQDPKGKLIPPFVIGMADVLVKEQAFMMEELNLLAKNIEHIKDIVTMQQSYARVSGFMEEIQLSDLVDDAVQLNSAALERDGIQVIRNFSNVPAVSVDKHKVLQILVNLVRNAKFALDEGGQEGKRIALSISLNEESQRVRVTVQDNGVGIQPENLTRIFSHGFTTRRNGHGFGLHSGALAAREMGGSLLAHSDGPGCGAVFTLELPVAPPKSFSA